MYLGVLDGRITCSISTKSCGLGKVQQERYYLNIRIYPTRMAPQEVRILLVYGSPPTRRRTGEPIRPFWTILFLFLQLGKKEKKSETRGRKSHPTTITTTATINSSPPYHSMTDFSSTRGMIGIINSKRYWRLFFSFKRVNYRSIYFLPSHLPLSGTPPGELPFFWIVACPFTF